MQSEQTFIRCITVFLTHMLQVRPNSWSSTETNPDVTVLSVGLHGFEGVVPHGPPTPHPDVLQSVGGFAVPHLG